MPVSKALLQLVRVSKPMEAISPFLNNNEPPFAPETTHAMSVAFEDACDTLQLPEKAKYAREVVALRIIDVARSGERDPVQLRDRAIRMIGVPGR
jgi:hypothetical protein